MFHLYMYVEYKKSYMEEKLNKVADYLEEQLSSIYCDTCKCDLEACEDCIRKQMGWQASREFCEKMANKITKMLNQ